MGGAAFPKSPLCSLVLYPLCVIVCGTVDDLSSQMGRLLRAQKNPTCMGGVEGGEHSTFEQVFYININNNSAARLAILIKGLMAGPAVSL